MAAKLPSYITSAKPVPASARIPWHKSTAPAYAGIFLWFVFWDSMSGNGLDEGGLVAAIAGILAGAIICHGLFYVVPGMLGMKTGLPLYVVGTSTFGTVGGLIMPGFLMGILQFGWLAVNTYASSKALVGSDTSAVFYVLCVAWALVAAFVGLKGIQHVGKVATFLPIIPLIVLIIVLVKFGGSAFQYEPPVEKPDAGVGILAMVGAIVGFFATAGAAGVDFGMSSRHEKDVQFGGFYGILIAIIVTAGISTLAVAGAHATGVVTAGETEAYHATTAIKNGMPGIYKIVMIGLVIAAFPGACFSSFVAANSFKYVMPKVNPFISVGLGAVVSIILAVTHIAGDLVGVFVMIGASFGPIVGAMTVDYYLAGKKWPGPRPGWNCAGWTAWFLGFIVGITPTLPADWGVPVVPCAPVAAFIVGAVVYFILAKAGLEGKAVPMEEAIAPAEGGETPA